MLAFLDHFLLACQLVFRVFSGIERARERFRIFDGIHFVYFVTMQLKN